MESNETPVDPYREVERLRKNILGLLNRAAGYSHCRAQECRAEVWFLKHLDGTTGVYNADGSSHFTTCANPNRFRSRKNRSAVDGKRTANQ
jgi:hypothetical protein